MAVAFSPGRGRRAKEVKVAVIAPISGPWARQGQLIQMGAEMAVDEINQKGGIKSLGGARLKLVVADAGDSAEKAKNAAQRLIAQEPDLVGGTGAWLSTFTLAVTEVTERAQIPWLTLSFADNITDRGFKYVFQTSPVASAQSIGAVPAILELAKAATGKTPATAGIIGDNTASPVFFLKPLREGGLEKVGIKVADGRDLHAAAVGRDAAHPEGALDASRDPDLRLDDHLRPQARAGEDERVPAGKGVIPVIGNGAHMGAPEVLKNVPADLLEGVMFIVADWGMKGHESIIETFKKRTGEPWITQDAITGYGDMWILKEALESAKSADKVKVADEIRKMKLTEGPAATAFPGGVQFDEKGRRMNAPLVIVQWQNGVPVTVSPVDRALAKPYWPKR